MSLAVDWSRVEPAPTDREQEHAVFSIGVTLAALGIRAVDCELAIDELLVRYRLYSRLNGPILRNGAGEDVGATRAFWRRWSGIRANVADEKRAAWVRRIVASAVSDIAYAILNERG